MWSGWRRDSGMRRKVGRSLREIKALRALDLRRVHLPDLKRLHLPDLHAPEIDWRRSRVGSRAAALWPAVLAAAGAGVAVWSWNQWARGRAGAQGEAAREAGLAPVRAPSSARAEIDRAGGQEGVAAPETIMAHAQAAPDASPASDDIVPGETLPAHVKAALDESLAVQASGAPSTRPDRAGA